MPRPPLMSNGGYRDHTGTWQNLWDQCEQKDARIRELEEKFIAAIRELAKVKESSK